jgi:excisionase family DNA binding protein
MTERTQGKDDGQQSANDPADPRLGNSEPLMKAAEVMNYLKVSRTKLWQLVKERGLPAYRIGGDFRYRKSEIDAWLEAQRHGPASNHSKETN